MDIAAQKSYDRVKGIKVYTARTKRLMLIELCIFLTLAGTTALAFRPIMALINRNIDIVRERIIDQAETLLERPIRYGSLGPSILGSLEIHDLTVGDGDYPLLSLNRFFIEYSLWDLLQRKGLGAVRYLVLEGPQVVYNAERDSGLISLFSGGGELELPPDCFFIIRDGSFSFANNGTALSAAGISIDGGIRGHEISLNGVWKNSPSPEGGVTLAGSIDGSFSDDFSRGSIAVKLDSISGKNFTVGKTGILLSFLEDRVLFEREEDSLPLALSASYVHKTKDFSASFFADGFSPGSLINLRGPLERFTPALSVAVSGEAEFSAMGGMPGEGGGNPSYYFALAGEAPQGSGGPLRGFDIRGAGDGKRLEFSRFTVNALSGSAWYSGDLELAQFFPQGQLVFSGFSLTGDTSVNGALSFRRTGSGLLFNAPQLSMGSTALTSFGGGVFNKDNGVDYNAGFYREGGGFFESRGSMHSKPGQFSGTAGLMDFYADDLLNIARPFVTLGPLPETVAEKVKINTAVSFNTDFKTFSYNTEKFDIAYGDGLSVSATVSGNASTLELEGGAINWEKGQAAFGFRSDFSNPDNINFLCSFGYSNFSYEFDGSIRDKSIFTIQSGREFSAQARNAQGRWSGSVTGAGIPIPYRGGSSYLSFDTALIFLNPASWSLSLASVEIQTAQGRTELSARGQANQNGLNLDRLYYADNAGPLSGSAAAVWSSDFSFIDASLFLMDQREAEKLAADIFYESGNLEFHGNLANFSGERIDPAAKNLKMTGEFFGVLSADGYYMINLSLKSLAGMVGKNNFSLSGSVLVEPEKLLLSQLAIGYGEMHGNIPFAMLDRNAGHMETEAQVFGMVNDNLLGMQSHLALNFKPMKTWFDIESLDAFSGILDIPYAYINDHETSEQFSFAFTRTPVTESSGGAGVSPAVYRLFGGPENMLSAELRESSFGNGVFSISLGNPSPVQGSINGIFNGLNIDALASEVYIDLQEFWDIAPFKKGISFTDGIITGSTRIFGSILDPEFEGTAWASGVTLMLPSFVPVEMGPGSGIITLESSDLSFGPVDAVCGSGHGILYAVLSLDHWFLSFDINIEVDKDVPFDLNIIGVMAKGNAKGNLNITQEGSELMTITGDLVVSDTELTLNTDEIFAAMDGTSSMEGSDVEADVFVTISKRLEFLWPDSKTPLLRAYAESGEGLRIMADTRVPMFAMDGNVSLRGGELYHLTRSFYIREGQLQFNGNSPEFNPLISARAEIRDNSDDGPVTIYMFMENVPLNDLTKTMPRYESSPSLSPLEIYGILGQAPPMESVVSSASSAALNPLLQTGAELILQRVVFRPVEQRIRNLLGLDMFSFRTQIIQNAVFETVRNRGPDEQPATFGNYLDNTTVFIGKYLGPDLFSQAMLSFQYDPTRREFAGGMRPELELGLDLRTPLFDIRWNLGPLHLESLKISDFVSNQSFSLVWRLSL